MNIKQCAFCTKPFQTLGRKICPECSEKADKDFFTVRDYLYENKRAGIDEVVEETGVSMQIIKHLIKEGRFDLIDAANVLLDCEVCKKPIRTGRMCKPCKDTVSSKMQESLGPQESKQSRVRTTGGTAKLTHK